MNPIIIIDATVMANTIKNIGPGIILSIEDDSFTALLTVKGFIDGALLQRLHNMPTPGQN
jgi:hypothetical protein